MMFPPFTATPDDPRFREKVKEYEAMVDRAKKNIPPPSEPEFYLLAKNSIILRNGAIVSDLILRNEQVGFIVNFIIDGDTSTLIIKFDDENSFWRLKEVMDHHAENLKG